MDVQKIIHIFIGCMISTVGILLLKHSHLVTGGAPGFALSISYLVGMPFSVAFILANLPFYILSVFRMGWNFTLSTLLAACLLSVMTEVDRSLTDFVVPNLVGAILGGGFAGLGLSYLFWNGASLGGVNILVLYLNRRFGWNPGKLTFICDFMIVLFGCSVIGTEKGLYSLLSIMAVSGVINYFKEKISQKNQVAHQVKPVEGH
ncbi:MAG: YitT family protein [Sporomusaceae bacterium]|nr:YitT family protein [Sporomusaceae bacterium]